VESKGCRIFEGPCEEKLVTDFFTGVGSRARRARRVRETERETGELEAFWA
jgi:hypothetical protein